nr:hypothetical protein [Bacillus sp. MMSF_3353]
MPIKELQDTVQHFTSFLLDKGRKPSTIKRYAYDIENFGQWLQKSKLGHSRCPQHFGKRTVRKDVSYPGRNEEKVFVDCLSKK